MKDNGLYALLIERKDFSDNTESFVEALRNVFSDRKKLSDYVVKLYDMGIIRVIEEAQELNQDLMDDIISDLENKDEENGFDDELIVRKAVRMWFEAYGEAILGLYCTIDSTVGQEDFKVLEKAKAGYVNGIRSTELDILGRKTIEEIINNIAEYDLQNIDSQALIRELNNETNNCGVDYNTQILIQLNIADQKRKEDDYQGFLECFEHAVSLGYKGNYSIIGKLFLIGKNSVERDIAKAYHWLSQFYYEYESESLVLDDDNCLISVCFSLGVCLLWKMQYEAIIGLDKEVKIRSVLDLWCEAVDIALENVDGYESEIQADILITIGYIFYYGIINLEKCDDIEISIDYELAFRAFSAAKRLGSIQALSMLAEMYEYGKYVDADEREASRKYLCAALKGEKRATNWSQKYFIDDLEWEKCTSWDKIRLESVLKHSYTLRVAALLEICTLEDFRNLKMYVIRGKSIVMIWVYRFFQEVREYVRLHDECS